jgi:hypothetical protein
MPHRNLIARVHRAAGVVAFLLVLLFWLSTIAVELLGDPAAVAAVKQAILWGMALLVPAIATAGATGFRLGGRSTAPVIAGKRRRMPILALNGLLVLVPSAIILAMRAAEGRFDALFYAVQAAELAAGAVNLALLGLKIRDGLAMTRPRRLRAQTAARA